MPIEILEDKTNYTSDKYSLFITHPITLSFESMYEVNKYLADNKIKPRIISQKISNTETLIDLQDGKITINGCCIDLEIPETMLDEVTENGLRWVNFNKNKKIYYSDGRPPTLSKICVIGWQGNTNSGANIQRLIAVKQDGSWELWKKR